VLTRSYRPVDLELRGDGRTVIGIAAPFNSPTEIREFGTSYTETIRRGAFARTIAERGASKVKLLAQHDMAKLPLGRADVLREDAGGLYIEARVSKTVAGDEALALVADGVLDAFSIGFTVTRDGERWNRDRTERDLVDVKLIEVSLTPFAAYSGALVSGIRADLYDPEYDPEFILRQMALTPHRKTPR